MQNYQLGDKIGQGGMGSVYRARHTGLDRDVAIKFMDAAVAQDEIGVERFLREAKLLAKIDHPNVVRVHDTGRDERGQPYIVMELLGGISLSERLRQGPMPEAEAVDIACQVLAALEEAHKLGIIHRDIKPSNIRQLSGGKVKLLDFGIARDEMLSSVTHTGKVIGTPAYMSPEQAEGRSAVPQSDLYALGIVIYEMLTGTAPFRAETPLAVLRMHVDHPPPALPGFVSKKLREAVGWALEKRPERRFPSAGAMREALHGVVVSKGTPEASPKIGAKPVGPKIIEIGGPTDRRLPAWVVPGGAILAVALLVFAFGSAMGWFSPPADATGTLTYTKREQIQFGWKPEYDSTLAKGRSRIKIPGKFGVKEVTYRSNDSDKTGKGKDIKVGERVLTRAVDEIRLIGTSPNIYCSKGHKDVWDSLYCGVCGEKFPPITERVSGQAPSNLQFDAADRVGDMLKSGKAGR